MNSLELNLKVTHERGSSIAVYVGAHSMGGGAVEMRNDHLVLLGSGKPIAELLENGYNVHLIIDPNFSYSL